MTLIPRDLRTTLLPRKPERRLAGVRVFNLRSVAVLLILSLLPGAASAFTFTALHVSYPDLAVVVLVAAEILFAVWVSGFMGIDDRRTIKDSFGDVLTRDYSRMNSWEIAISLLWGSESLLLLIFRVWIALALSMITAVLFATLEPALILDLRLSPVLVLLAGFTLPSYVLIRNLCEERLRHQAGHALLVLLLFAVMAAGLPYTLQ